MESFDVYGDLLVKDKKVRRYVSFFCSWGPKMADYLIERDWFDEKQVQITGTPRTDFYHGSLRKSAKARSRYVDPYCKNLVLINSNFTIGNPGFLTPKEEFELLVRLGREPDEVRKRQANDGESIKLLTNMANRLAERFEEANFIYRPHPFERIETYDDLLEPKKNLHCIREGTVDGWIMNAKAVIQHSCSTAIESGLARVPSFSPDWLPELNCGPAVKAVSIPCGAYEEMERNIGAVLDGVYQAPPKIEHNLEKVIKDWFFSVDGEAYKRIVDVIFRSLPTGGAEERKRKSLKMKAKYIRGDMRLVKRIRSTLREAFGLNDRRFTRRRLLIKELTAKWDRSEKRFDADQVREIIESIRDCMNSTKRFNVSMAQDDGDYIFDYLTDYSEGRSVKISPVDC